MIDRSKIPACPGVYLFKDRSGEIIYVGKAINLRKRVSSYFTGTKSPKTAALVEKIHDAEFIVVDNEIEALLLENRLIKSHKPQYNISLKDSKTYAYIKITDEKFPRILVTRSIKDGGKYFGPYIDSQLREELIELVIKVFNIRTCRNMPKKECLNYHIGLCSGPCAGKISCEEYSKRASEASSLLKGDASTLRKMLIENMNEASRNMRYEIALERRNQLSTIDRADQKQRIEMVKEFDQDVIAFAPYGDDFVFDIFYIKKGLITGKREFVIHSSFEQSQEEVFENFIKTYYSKNEIPREIIVGNKFWQDNESHNSMESYLGRLRNGKTRIVFPKSGENHGLLMLAQKNADLKIENKVLLEIQKSFGLQTMPRIIECFDISNLGYSNVVGAMARYVDGEKDKSGYRKFEIKSFSGKNDDFAAMKEVVFRRYKRLIEEGKALPNLIIIDGGKGHLNSALESLTRLGLRIPVISIAKANEEIFLPGTDEPKIFSRNSSMMLFIRSVRDETHGFAISYNRKKRSMAFRKETGSKGQ